MKPETAKERLEILVAERAFEVAAPLGNRKMFIHYSDCDDVRSVAYVPNHYNIAQPLVFDGKRVKVNQRFADRLNVKDVLRAERLCATVTGDMSHKELLRYWREQRKEQTRKRSDAGLCTRCGAQSRPGKAYCQTCADKTSEANRLWRAKRKTSA